MSASHILLAYAPEEENGDERWRIEPDVGWISQLAIGEGMVLFCDYKSRNGALYVYGDP